MHCKNDVGPSILVLEFREVWVEDPYFAVDLITGLEGFSLTSHLGFLICRLKLATRSEWE